jgi:ubiquinone/menaquinone biosynthesis C-methylase UbiE
MTDDNPQERQPRDARPPQAFDPFAEVYDRLIELTGQPLLDLLSRLLPEHGGSALDLGCGNGQHAMLLADRFDEVVAVDISKPMLDLARTKRSRPNVVYVEADLREVTSERGEPFDVVLSAYALHHVSELETALQQIRSLVAPGGQAVLIDIVNRRGKTPRWWRYLDAARRFPADLMRRGPREAAEVYGLRTYPPWLAHVDTDRFLRPQEFDQRYGAVFAGARFASLERGMRVMWWKRPGEATGA